jgi:hypothetical protein
MIAHASCWEARGGQSGGTAVHSVRVKALEADFRIAGGGKRHGAEVLGVR